MVKNKYGLSRTIPQDIQREVRRRCGFGCVICGSNIFTYEHVIPEFKDAYNHDPNCIALLCHQCHGKVTRRQLSKSSVIKALENPITKQQGFSNEWFDFNEKQPEIYIGGNIIYNCTIPLLVNNKPLLYIRHPINPAEPIELSGVFFDNEGKVSLRIIKNEWFVRNDVWDMTVIGPVLRVYNEGNLVLQLTVYPPGAISIDFIDMKMGDYTIYCTPDILKFEHVSGRTSEIIGCEAIYSEIGFEFE